jgi:hypothetical protein
MMEAAAHKEAGSKTDGERFPNPQWRKHFVIVLLLTK